MRGGNVVAAPRNGATATDLQRRHSTPIADNPFRRKKAAMISVVRPGRFPQDATAVLQIWREFVASPSVSLDYQNYEAEFANLPGRYAPLEGRLLAEAKAAGYEEMRLDVLEEFKQARKLYMELGFVPADPVSCNPLPSTSFLGLTLR